MGGTLTGGLSYHPRAASPTRWEGEMLVAGAKLMSAGAGSQSLVAGDIAFRSAPEPAVDARLHKKHTPPPLSGSTFVLLPTPLALGGKEPAMLEGRFDATGYTLHLTGMASSSRLLALRKALPDLGDGLAKVLPVDHAAAPFRLDLIAVRPWAEEQVWTEAPVHPVGHRSRRARRP